MNFLKTSRAEPSPELFESILNVNEFCYEQKEMTISQKDYVYIINNPGSFTRIDFYCHGNSKWFFFHALDGRKIFIIENPTSSGSFWCWRIKNAGELTVLKPKRRNFDIMTGSIKKIELAV